MITIAPVTSNIRTLNLFTYHFSFQKQCLIIGTTAFKKNRRKQYCYIIVFILFVLLKLVTGCIVFLFH